MVLSNTKSNPNGKEIENAWSFTSLTMQSQLKQTMNLLEQKRDGRRRQEEQEFKVAFIYIAISRSISVI